MRIPSQGDSHLADLQRALASTDDLTPGAALRRLIDGGHDRLPLPGHGATLTRWRLLAAVASHDLSLAKLFEGHTDALAILAEAGAGPQPEGAVWATWCAEPPDARVALVDSPRGPVLRGRKAWCSGADVATHAVVSCWRPDGAAMLAAVDLGQPGVRVTGDGWQAVGMATTRSVDVWFDDVPATVLGGPGFYVQRPGFWHGGAGIAACWYGAATRLADILHARLAERSDPHRLAQLGQVAIALQGSAALLREAAQAIDDAPTRDAMALALTVRLHVEAGATRVLDLVGRALGAGPLCKDASLARLAADLPVFLRQSHAERDLEALARTLTPAGETPWAL